MQTNERPCADRTPLLKNKRFLAAHRYALSFYAFVLVYDFIIVCRCKLPAMSGIAYLYHAVDFKMGFCSKFFIGGIYNLFVKTPSVLSATVYEYAIMLLFLLCVCGMLERLVLVQSEKERPVVFFLSLFFLTGPSTFGVMWRMLGVIDVYWIYLCVLFVLFLQNKKTLLILPVLFVVAIMVHTGALITYIPFFALLLLYEFIMSKDQNTRRVYLSVFLVSIILSIGSFLFFTVNDKKNVQMDMDSFHQVLSERGVDNPLYYDYALFYGQMDEQEYREKTGTVDQYEGFNPKELFPGAEETVFLSLLQQISFQVQIHFFEYSRTPQELKSLLLSVLFFIVVSPVFVILINVFRDKWKKTRGKHLDRFIWFCLLIFSPFVYLISFFIASGRVRWTYHFVFILFSFVLYTIYREKKNITEGIAAFSTKIPTFFKVLYMVIYSFSIIDVDI